jgi:iron complex outermembrane recepter protein
MRTGDNNWARPKLNSQEGKPMSRFTLMIAASVLAMAATPAFAQQAAPDEEEKSGIAEITVTAQRRNESVQDVPIAISAFTSDQLETQGISNTYQLGQYVPNLFALNNTGLGSANG